MTKRTIPVEKTVDEPLYVCDYCGKAEDDRDGEMVTFRAVDATVDGDDEVPELHLHETCVADGVGNIGPRPREPNPMVQLVSMPARKAAKDHANREGRDEITSEDEAIGWMVYVFFILAFLVLFVVVL